MSNRTRVKICGITKLDDALFAIDQGVDALGFVFCDKSPRNISIQNAKKIINSLPAFVATVALFMDEKKTFVDAVINDVPLMTLQFHGEESESFCNQFCLPYIKSIAMGSNHQKNTIFDGYKSSQSLLLDSNELGKIGGSGKSFDWNSASHLKSQTFILAGGLNPFNVAQAIKILNPYALDVSSGVEAQKGIKNQQLIKTFMENVNKADNDN